MHCEFFISFFLQNIPYFGTAYNQMLNYSGFHSLQLKSSAIRAKLTSEVVCQLPIFTQYHLEQGKSCCITGNFLPRQLCVRKKKAKRSMNILVNWIIPILEFQNRHTLPSPLYGVNNEPLLIHLGNLFSVKPPFINFLNCQLPAPRIFKVNTQ